MLNIYKNTTGYAFQLLSKCSTAVPVLVLQYLYQYLISTYTSTTRKQNWTSTQNVDAMGINNTIIVD